jgi:Prp8 binding protein
MALVAHQGGGEDTQLLSGHQGEVFSLKFSSDGRQLATGSSDRLVLIWDLGEPQAVNSGVLRGHTSAILELHWDPYHHSRLYTCSADKSAALWDCETLQRVKKFTGHSAIVNSCHPLSKGSELLVTGSDDGTLKLWDLRSPKDVTTLNATWPVLAVSFDEYGERVFSASIDNQISVWNVHSGTVTYKLSGHTDTVTGLAVSPDSTKLLSNSRDGSLKIWDIGHFVQENRCLQTLRGVGHNYEHNLLKAAWKHDSSQVSAGSADHFVNIWELEGSAPPQKLAGHHGSVNEVVFSPKGSVVASGSSDRYVMIGPY